MIKVNRNAESCYLSTYTFPCLMEANNNCSLEERGELLLATGAPGHNTYTGLLFKHNGTTQHGDWSAAHFDLCTDKVTMYNGCFKTQGTKPK